MFLCRGVDLKVEVVTLSSDTMLGGGRRTRLVCLLAL